MTCAAVRAGARTSSMAVKVPVAPPKWVGELVRQNACAGDLDSLSTKRSRRSSWKDSQGSCTSHTWLKHVLESQGVRLEAYRHCRFICGMLAARQAPA